MLLDELTHITRSEKQTIKYLFKKGVLEKKKICYKCKSIMIIDINQKIYRCQKKGHNISCSIFNQTFLSTCKFGVHNLLKICYLYLHKVPTTEIVKMTGIQSEAVTSWCLFLREMLADDLNTEDIRIGGENVIVEIDETKLGKRKYNRGHLVDGVWVVGGIERTPQKKAFLIEVADRTSDTLQNVISTFVLPGSIIYTDCFAAYNRACTNLNLEHFTVNHKENYVDPISGTHTNTIEGLNNGIKHLIKPRNRGKKNINGWLFYFIWRRQNKKNVWKGFINSLKSIKYI